MESLTKTKFFFDSVGDDDYSSSTGHEIILAITAQHPLRFEENSLKMFVTAILVERFGRVSVSLLFEVLSSLI